MEIKISDNQQSFKRIITGNTVKNKLCSSDCPKYIVNRFVQTRKFLRKQNVSKTKNFDSVLEYNMKDGFYIRVQSENNRFLNPEVSPYFKNVINSEICIKDLNDWVNYWEDVCKP